ncbi:MAG TPA: hypothetical protein VH682_31885 [Gemmataceae bacterium]
MGRPPWVTAWRKDPRIGKPSTQPTAGEVPRKVYDGWLKLSGALGPDALHHDGECPTERRASRRPIG